MHHYVLIMFYFCTDFESIYEKGAGTLRFQPKICLGQI